MIVDPSNRIAGLIFLILVFGGCVQKSENINLMNPELYGQPNPNAPEELSQFAFLIGSWRCDIRVKGSSGSFETHQAIWTARYILDGYAIADEYRETTPDGQLVRFGATYRSYDSERDTWVMKWHDALTSTWIDLGPAELGGIQADGNSVTFKHRVPHDGLIRCTFSNISEKHFTWLGEFSSDGGGTWDDVMEIQAFRVKE